MLKAVPPTLTPDLLWVLAAMGHGDRLALVNANYPAYSRHERVTALPGVSLLEAATAILQLMPVDDLNEAPAYRMVPEGKPDEMLEVHRDLQQVLDAAESRSVPTKALERAAFFELAATSFAVVLTADNRPYGCFVIAKGVVRTA
jgi:L-fucose mutarotase